MTKCDHVNIENMKKAVQALDRAIDADIDEKVIQILANNDTVSAETIISISKAADKSGATDNDIDKYQKLISGNISSETINNVSVIVDQHGEIGCGNEFGWPFDVYACKQDANLIATALNEASLLAVADDPDFNGTLEEQRKFWGEKKYPDYYVVTNTLNGLVDNFTDVDWENVPSLVIGNIQEAKRRLEDAIQRLS